MTRRMLNPTTTDWQEALALAEKCANASSWDSYVVAIWEGDDGYIRALCYQGHLYCD